MTESNVVVLDNGSGLLRAGFSNSPLPKVAFPCVVGRGRLGCAIAPPPDYKYLYVGEEAQADLKYKKTLKYPVKDGIITNWDDMETIWRHAFNDELKVANDEFPILVTETLFNPKANKERMAQIMFESYYVSEMCVLNQSLLSLFAVGRTTGLAVESGFGNTHSVPFIDGRLSSKGLRSLDFAGNELTLYLKKLLTERGYDYFTSVEMFKFVEEMKEKACYVAQNFDASNSKLLEQTYKLPDGRYVTIGNECIKCPEALFRPSLLMKECAGIHDTVLQSLLSCDVEIRTRLYQNIVLSGGSTLFDGFVDRFAEELSLISPKSDVIKVIAPSQRRHLAWIGGSMFASLSAFHKFAASREEYDEFGPTVIHKHTLTD